MKTPTQHSRCSPWPSAAVSSWPHAATTTRPATPPPHRLSPPHRPPTRRGTGDTTVQPTPRPRPPTPAQRRPPAVLWRMSARTRSSSRPTGCPEAEHGFLYQLIGDGYDDRQGQGLRHRPADRFRRQRHGRQARRSAPVARPATSTAVSTIMYNDEASCWATSTPTRRSRTPPSNPTVAIESGFKKNPQMIMWDPASYPDVTDDRRSRQDRHARPLLQRRGVHGLLHRAPASSKADQVDGSYERRPEPLHRRRGQGRHSRASARPSRTSTRTCSPDWLQAGQVRSTSTTSAGTTTPSRSRPSRRTSPSTPTASRRSCRSSSRRASTTSTIRRVPTAIILDAVASSARTSAGSTTRARPTTPSRRSRPTASWPTALTASMGKFDMDRVTDLITKAIPVYTAQDSPPKEGLTAEDIVTNEFIDASIGL